MSLSLAAIAARRVIRLAASSRNHSSSRTYQITTLSGFRTNYHTIAQYTARSVTATNIYIPQSLSAVHARYPSIRPITPFNSHRCHLSSKFVHPSAVEKQTYEQFQVKHNLQKANGPTQPRKKRKWLRRVANVTFTLLTLYTIYAIYEVSIIIRDRDKHRVHGFIVEDYDIDYHTSLRFKQVESKMNPLDDFKEHQKAFLRDTAIIYRRVDRNRKLYTDVKTRAEAILTQLEAAITPEQRKEREDMLQQETAKRVQLQKELKQQHQRKILNKQTNTAMDQDEYVDNNNDDDNYYNYNAPNDDDHHDNDDQFIPFQDVIHQTMGGMGIGPIPYDRDADVPSISRFAIGNRNQWSSHPVQDEHQSLAGTKLSSFASNLHNFLGLSPSEDAHHRTEKSFLQRMASRFEHTKQRVDNFIRIGSQLDFSPVYSYDSLSDDDDDDDNYPELLSDHRPLLTVFRPSDLFQQFIKVSTEIPNQLRQAEQDLIRVNQLVYNQRVDDEMLLALDHDEQTRQFAQMLLDLQDNYDMLMEIRDNIDMTSSMIRELEKLVNRCERFVTPLQFLERLL